MTAKKKNSRELAAEFLDERNQHTQACVVCPTLTEEVEGAIGVFIERKQGGATCSARRYVQQFLRPHLGVVWGHNALLRHIRVCLGVKINAKT